MESRTRTGPAEPEHPEDSLAAFALDALPEGEREAVLAHLAGCSTCAATVAQYREVADVLPLAEPPESPDPRLRARILDRAAQTPQRRPLSLAKRGTPAQRWRRFWEINPAGWLVAAALFLVSLGLGAWNYALQNEIQGLQQASAGLAIALAATADAPGARGQVVVAASGDVLSVRGLPPPTIGQVYEAWVIGSAGPLPAGTFVTTPDGLGALVLTKAPGRGEVVAITNEPSPGGSTPSGKVLLKGTV